MELNLLKFCERQGPKCRQCSLELLADTNETKPAMPVCHAGSNHATQTTALCRAPRLLTPRCDSSKGKCIVLMSLLRRLLPLLLATTTGFSASARYRARFECSSCSCVCMRGTHMPHSQAFCAILCPPVHRLFLLRCLFRRLKARLRHLESAIPSLVSPWARDRSVSSTLSSLVAGT